eukprot:12445427-Prorocentrum_lima.AAC.1
MPRHSRQHAVRCSHARGRATILHMWQGQPIPLCRRFAGRVRRVSEWKHCYERRASCPLFSCST